MLDAIPLYIGSVVVIVWGIAHIAPTKSVVASFGPLSDPNRRIITMEWVGKGLAFCFIGVLVLLTPILQGADASGSILVYRACAAIAFVVGAWTFAIGFKTSVVPVKVCPLVLTVVAVLFILGSVL